MQNYKYYLRFLCLALLLTSCDVSRLSANDLERLITPNENWDDVERVLDEHAIYHGFYSIGERGDFDDPNWEAMEIGHHVVIARNVRNFIIFKKTLRYFVVVNENGFITRVRTQNVSPML